MHAVYLRRLVSVWEDGWSGWSFLLFMQRSMSLCLNTSVPLQLQPWTLLPLWTCLGCGCVCGWLPWPLHNAFQMYTSKHPLT